MEAPEATGQKKELVYTGREHSHKMLSDMQLSSNWSGRDDSWLVSMYIVVTDVRKLNAPP